MTAPTAVGIDIGGTKVAGVRIDDAGTVQATLELPTPAEDVQATLEVLDRVVVGLRDGAVAVGVGAAGMVDSADGIMRFAPNLAWREVPIRDVVTERTGLPCLVDNDANVAAWGEFRFGAARSYEDVVLMITVGTGIGGAIISGGRLFRGAHGFASEVGHFIVEPNGPLCGCGNLGCWEQVAGGRALDRAGRKLAEDPSSAVARLAGDEEVRGRHVALAAHAGDPAAVAAFAEVGRRLGEGIAGLVNVIDPEAVVVGGGVAEEGDLILEPARKAFLAAVEAVGHRPHVPVVPAVLGNRAGALGAAALALELG